jgi:predicted kinase
MKYLKVFGEYKVNEEWSKNDPIPELNSKDKIGIILLGPPAVGKSTFATNYIIHKNRDIKIFSTDDVSLTRTKDHSQYKKGSSELNVKRLKLFIKTGGSFIYDTTGTQKENISSITKLAHSEGYQVIFIHLIGTLDMSLKQNIQRERNVPSDFIKHAYDEQFKNMKFFSQLRPESYYIVYNIDGKYKFMKYEDGKILKRKVDKYVALKESVSTEDEFDIEDVMLYVIDLVDAGYRLEFSSIDGINLKTEDIQNKSDAFKKFNLTSKLYSKIKSKFTITILGKNGQQDRHVSFKEFEDIISIMGVSTQHFKSKGWTLNDFRISKNDWEGEVTFNTVSFTYTKPDQEIKVERDKSLEKSISTFKIIRAFENKGIYIEARDIVYYDGYIQIQRYDVNEREASIEDRLYDVCDLLGAGEWEWENGKSMINLLYE